MPGSKHPSHICLRDTSSCQQGISSTIYAHALKVECRLQLLVDFLKIMQEVFLACLVKTKVCYYIVPLQIKSIPSILPVPEMLHSGLQISSSFLLTIQAWSDFRCNSQGQLLKYEASLHSFKFPGDFKKAPKHAKSLDTKQSRYQAKSYRISCFLHTMGSGMITSKIPTKGPTK